MKLMTPTQLKEVKSNEQTRDILRIQEIQETLKKYRLDLAQAETDFKTALANNRDAWAREEEEHATRIKDMAKEVELLQHKKAQALIPVELYKNEAEEKMTLADQVMNQAKVFESELSERAELLQAKLDEVGEREVTVKDREDKVLSREQGAASQSKATQENASQLTELMQSWQETKSKEEQEIYGKKKELQLREMELDNLAEKLRKDKESFNILQIQLNDRQATLERSWKEFEAKK